MNKYNQSGHCESDTLKELTWEVEKMRCSRPILYGLIKEHMSVESKDEVAQEPNLPSGIPRRIPRMEGNQENTQGSLG
jgi:hypothetical protein